MWVMWFTNFLRLIRVVIEKFVLGGGGVNCDRAKPEGNLGVNFSTKCKICSFEQNLYNFILIQILGFQM